METINLNLLLKNELEIIFNNQDNKLKLIDGIIDLADALFNNTDILKEKKSLYGSEYPILTKWLIVKK